MNPNTSDRKSQRQFGLVMAAALTVIALARWALHGDTGPWLFAGAAVLLVLGLVAPGTLRPLFWAWMQFALALNWVVTRILLTIAFFALITPTRLVLRLLGKDTLHRAIDPHAPSYWEPAEEQPSDPEAYRRQF